jgi:hypothetical protein
VPDLIGVLLNTLVFSSVATLGDRIIRVTSLLEYPNACEPISSTTGRSTKVKLVQLYKDDVPTDVTLGNTARVIPEALKA